MGQIFSPYKAKNLPMGASEFSPAPLPAINTRFQWDTPNFEVLQHFEDDFGVRFGVRTPLQGTVDAG